MTMAKTISKKISGKASVAKPSEKPPSGDKTLGIDPEICLYTLEDGDETSEGEESGILVVYNSNLGVSKQNLVKRKLTYIDTLNHEGNAVVNTMSYRTNGVFEHLYITSPIHVDQRVYHKQCIIIGAALKNYKAVLVECKQLAKDIVGYKWDLIALKEIFKGYFWNWSKKNRTVYYRYTYLGLDKCVNL